MSYYFFTTICSRMHISRNMMYILRLIFINKVRLLMYTYNLNLFKFISNRTCNCV